MPDPENTVVDLLAALEQSVIEAREARKQYHNRTPRQRWGTCCPYDPECEHSLIDDDVALTRWLDTPITDEEVERLGYGTF